MSNTVFPSALSLRMIFRSICAPSGSGPTVGSSMDIISGSLISPPAICSRWIMPFANVSAKSSALSPRSTSRKSAIFPTFTLKLLELCDHKVCGNRPRTSRQRSDCKRRRITGRISHGQNGIDSRCRHQRHTGNLRCAGCAAYYGIRQIGTV